MTFQSFSEPVQARFAQLSEGELFVVKADDIFERYLAAYPPGTNPMFRTRTEYDCQCCKQFVRRLGVVVGIRGGKVITLWGDHVMPEPYKTVAEELDSYIGSLPIESVFRTKESQYGAAHSYEAKTERRWEHFVGTVASKHKSANPDTLRGERAAVFQVAQRGLKELREEHLTEVIELINNSEIYRGEEHLCAVVGFRQLLRDYHAAKNSDWFIWEHLENRYARFRNTAIGSLLVDLADGTEVDAAVASFETKVAPMNYKRPTSVITQRMIEGAVQTLTDLGLGGAIYRRYAKFSDMKVPDVLFVDNESKSKMKDQIVTLLEESVKRSTPDTSMAIHIKADDFIKTVLPGARSVDVLVENRHTGNFVSLTGSDGPERLFKWDNNFAWSYDGDVADSVKQRVKAAGGNVLADLRVSLSWFNFDDLDLHAEVPSGHHVWYGDKMGILDVDMNAGGGRTRTPVENLAFLKPRDGMYKIWVHQYSQRETVDFGFAIEIECGGALHQYSYPSALRNGVDVQCFAFTVKGGKLEKITTVLKGGKSSLDKWGVKTETLVPVSAIMYSPNHWGGQAVGPKHTIFALRGCKNPEPTRGIFNEYLRNDLDKHRKVFEVLGSKTKCQPTEDQVSGIGFTAARGDAVTVVVDGRRSYILSF